MRSRIAANKSLGTATSAIWNVTIPVSLDDREQNATPELGTVVVATPQHGPFKIAVLVEQEQRMIASALEVTVVRRALLFAMRLAELAIQIQDQIVERSTLVNGVDPCAGQIHQRREILPRTQHLRLEPAHFTR